jgi:hypothetical protein
LQLHATTLRFTSSAHRELSREYHVATLPWHTNRASMRASGRVDEIMHQHVDVSPIDVCNRWRLLMMFIRVKVEAQIGNVYRASM